MKKIILSIVLLAGIMFGATGCASSDPDVEYRKSIQACMSNPNPEMVKYCFSVVEKHRKEADQTRNIMALFIFILGMFITVCIALLS
jgi:hypothetical protein